MRFDFPIYTKKARKSGGFSDFLAFFVLVTVRNGVSVGRKAALAPRATALMRSGARISRSAPACCNVEISAIMHFFTSSS